LFKAKEQTYLSMIFAKYGALTGKAVQSVKFFMLEPVQA
jgi:hypothetical protein